MMTVLKLPTASSFCSAAYRTQVTAEAVVWIAVGPRLGEEPERLVTVEEREARQRERHADHLPAGDALVEAHDAHARERDRARDLGADAFGLGRAVGEGYGWKSTYRKGNKRNLVDF